MYSFAIGISIGILAVSGCYKFMQQLFFELTTTDIGKIFIPDIFIVLIEGLLVFSAIFWGKSYLMGCILCLYFICLFVYAATSRGKECNCFGRTGGTIGIFHLVSLASIAAILAITTFGQITAADWHAGKFYYSILIGVSFGIYWRRRKINNSESLRNDNFMVAVDSPIKRMYIITKSGCPSCDALKEISAGYWESLPIEWLPSYSQQARKEKIASFPTAILVTENNEKIQLAGISQILSAIIKLNRFAKHDA